MKGLDNIKADLDRIYDLSYGVDYLPPNILRNKLNIINMRVVKTLKVLEEVRELFEKQEEIMKTMSDMIMKGYTNE